MLLTCLAMHGETEEMIEVLTEVRSISDVVRIFPPCLLPLPVILI